MSGEPSSPQIVPIGNNWTAKSSNRKEQIVNVNSQITDCIWHKIMIHGSLPKKTEITVSYFVTPEKTHDINALQPSWSQSAVNQRQVIIDAGKGQNLWLKITIVSNKKGEFPTVKNVKAFFANVNYLQYLPEFYQQDPAGNDFMQRYLTIFELTLQKIENEIDDTPELVNAKLTPSEFLPWLSTWVGTVKDENWPEAKWREFLSQAALLYRYRGTKKELEEIIKIYTGKYPVAVVERALLKTGSPEFQAMLDALFGDKYSFCVLLWPRQVRNEVDQKVIKRVIENEKPAHTVGGFVILENKIHLDWHSYLGVNSYVTEYKAEMYVGKATVPIDTVITQPIELKPIEKPIVVKPIPKPIDIKPIETPIDVKPNATNESFK